MPLKDCDRLCTTEARDSGCKTMWVLQPPFVSSGGRGVGKAGVPSPHSSFLSCSQVYRAGRDCLSEGLALGEPTETPNSLNKRQRCCVTLEQPFPF